MFTLMSSNKKKLIRNLISINGTAGCGCGKPKLTDVIQPKPKSKATTSSSSTSANQMTRFPISSSTPSSWDRNGGLSMDDDEADYTSTTFSLTNFDTYSLHQSEADVNINVNNKHSKNSYDMISQSTKIRNSVAVVKDSSDPYHDFRQSMLQMIFEREIFSLDDLQELLNCFLELNSPSQCDIIVQAFLDILNNDEFFFSSNSSSSSSSSQSITEEKNN